MNAVTLALILISQVCLVAGQLVIKQAMNLTHRTPKPWLGIVGLFAGGLALMTFCFFLWLAFLQRLDLSYIFPFEGLSPVVLVVATWIFLGEKLDARSWLAVALIAGGIVLVAVS